VGVRAHRALDLEEWETDGSLPRLRRLEDEILERFADLAEHGKEGEDSV
jgi:hypothetical protein